MLTRVWRVALCTLLTPAVLMLSSCGGGGGGGGGGGTVPPPQQFILLTNGRVVVAQEEGRVVIRAGESQLPGVGFDRDEVEVRIYEGDIFDPPRESAYPPPGKAPLSTVTVDRNGTLRQDLRLPAGRYTAVAENIRVVQDGKEFRSALTAYVFDVFPAGGALRTTLPTKFEAKFPALGSFIENSYVAFLTDAAAANGTSRLFVWHANGTVDMTRTFVAQTEAGQPVAAMSFEALPEGAKLGNVSRLILKAFKP